MWNFILRPTGLSAHGCILNEHGRTCAKLSWREGLVITWAGMRGAVTVAAAQTIPEGTPGRNYLLLLAFMVAAGSLIVQGGTLGALVRWVKPAPDTPSSRQERLELRRALYSTACSVPVPDTLAAAVAGVTEKRIHQMPLVDLIRVARESQESGQLGETLHQEISAYETARIEAKREFLVDELRAGRVRPADFEYQLDAQQMVIELQH